jgi:flagellar hook-associated protein 3 FlgL
MRIATQQLFQGGTQSLGTAQAKVLESQQRLSGGQQRLRPSDDPINAETSLLITANLDRLARFERNQGSAKSRLQVEETAMAGLTENLQRLRELAVGLGSGILSEQDAPGIRTEIKALKDQALSIANERSPTGEALFAGSANIPEAFTVGEDGKVTYLGTEAAREMQIGPGRVLELAPPGKALFGEVPSNRPLQLEVDDKNTGSAIFAQPRLVPTGGALGEMPVTATYNATEPKKWDLTFGDGSSGDALDQPGLLAIPGAEVAFEGEPSDGDKVIFRADEAFDFFSVYDQLLIAVDEPRSDAASQARFQNRLQGAQDRLAAAEDQISTSRSVVGAKLSALDAEASVQSARRLELQAQKSVIDDLDFVSAITAFQQQLVALQAAQSAFTRISDLSLFNYLR